MLDLRIDMVAFLLQRLAHLAERLDLGWELVAPASDTAAPLAHALAELLGGPVAPLPDREGRRTLLVAANAAELEPLCAGLARNRSDLAVFSLNLDWSRDNAALPSSSSCMARASPSRPHFEVT